MPQIIPIKYLKNTSEISDMCHKTEEPIYVTKNGYGDMVIMSMEVYESTMRQIAMYRDIEISEKQIEAGQVKDDRTANVFARVEPVAHRTLTKEQFDAEIEKGMEDIKAGRVYSADEVEAEMKREFGI
ncbi:MAG: type II toxin-antitoxin system Phd/YefM family antitoxin [Agathobacter sp.]|uniref:type II toxin-antitoxin system Phd/YefM family antitoxin n=1 Tax=Agathobacter sp. TaxID=2021311 RepID=UPI002E77872C|nr:type II toxin-antitoxin system Phd/YefM family antitoxin [Agathobacter sp.]MEE1216895.1 type II toxin-antitoxin system Phd/YefM family antitoxin [Agathobacter sp.]